MTNPSRQSIMTAYACVLCTWSAFGFVGFSCLLLFEIGPRGKHARTPSVWNHGPRAVSHCHAHHWKDVVCKHTRLDYVNDRRHLTVSIGTLRETFSGMCGSASAWNDGSGTLLGLRCADGSLLGCTATCPSCFQIAFARLCLEKNHHTASGQMQNQVCTCELFCDTIGQHWFGKQATQSFCSDNTYPPASPSFGTPVIPYEYDVLRRRHEI